ncbi:MAG: undecaprenyl/decaprenyl-phosphate alpha-N-acetylglucosaminyl 1-phosphate transferase [Deltaproteobacteria bacterium]|nr:undecaprenyl/decaprenyl-phosphate alpha-N-acetylglucosaminyl 1-phosphate transferase [Deltaproteobacteria bacterium]
MQQENAKFKGIIYSIAITVFIILILPFVREWFHNRGSIRWLHIFLISSAFSFIATPLVKRFALKYNILDIPDARKVHSSPIPLMGGLGIYLAFLISILNNAIFPKELFAIIIGASIVFISGILDDVLKLSSRLRLSLQILAVTILLLNGISIIIFEQNWWGVLLNSFLTYIWIIGITNSMNFFDGMDGLATGLSILISFFIGIVAFQTNQPFLGWLAIAIMGGCIGFLPYNFGSRKPAGIFLGDSGSNFLGFTLASIAVMGEWSEKSMVSSLATPILIFSILIYDMTYITIERFASGKVHNIKEWLDYVGKDHLHHRMDRLLSSKRKTVLFIYLLSFTLGLNALLLRNTDHISAIILLTQVSCILIIVTIMEIASNKDRNRG